MKEEGFNIGGEYFYQYDAKQKRLTSQEKKGYIKEFWGENISEICSVVGTNGAGKSTLLSEIVKFILKMDNCRRIVIYEIDEGIFYTHNLEHEIIVEAGIERRELKDEEIVETIFISNSMEPLFEGCRGIRPEIGRYILNDAMLATEGEKITRDFRLSREKWDTNKGIRKNQLATLADSKRINRYENIDNLFKVYFLTNASLKEYGMEKWGKIVIRFNCNNAILATEKRNMFLYKISNNLIIKRRTFFDEIKFFYYLEIQHYYENQICYGLEEITIIDIYRIRESIEKIALAKNGKACDMEYYFISAADELIEFHNMLSKVIQDKDEKGTYLQADFWGFRDFLKQIFKAVRERRASFLLRYFSFELDKTASGEDALLKLYSRIYWVFCSQEQRKNIILLIDEIDLYMHPKWQRVLINKLVNDIGKIVGEESKIQIIFTTHSPIILSDIPKANILFLKNEQGKCVVENNEIHKETFGNNVHTLFLDSFFLDEEGTIGEYAERKINEVIQLLRKGDIPKDAEQGIKEVIKCVGDPLINKKLMLLYKEVIKGEFDEMILKNKTEINTIDSMIVLLKKQIKNLQESIYDLERMKNDKNSVN
ncbi:MAG: AAA family ATPase [Lachnospiraceae bacterium]|nr:AAA family ATPase [Lachnospiraceae bacterium]